MRQQDSSRDEKEGVGNVVAHTARRGLGGIAEGLTWLGVISLMLIMLMTVCDVTGRFFFNQPIKGTHELVEAALVFVATSGMILVTAAGRNVGVKLLTSRFPEHVQRILVTIMDFVAFVVFGVVARQLWISGFNWMDRGLYTPVLHIQFYVLKFCFAAGVSVICLIFLSIFIRSLGKLR